jgi:endoglucanase
MKKILISCVLLGNFIASMLAQPVNDNGLLKVNGNKIVNKNGNAVSFAGNSLFWSQWGGAFWNRDCINWLKKDWNTTIVRAAMGVEEGGYLTNPDTEKQRVITVVDACIAAGLYVIIDWHDHNAQYHTSQAVAFFKEMASKYGTYPNVMYEIFNEPLQVSWSGVVKPYAEQVVSAIRSIDPDNLIIVGTPSWSQNVDEAAGNPLTYNNIAYTLHFYAATHKGDLRWKAQQALDKGIALFVTEWGTCDALGSGSVDEASTREWMTFLKEKSISHCNWSLFDKPEAASALVPGASTTGGWPASSLTTSGTLVKSIISNWSPVAPVCTTYEVGATIEAENYCNMSGIQTESCSEGGVDVGWIDTNDWMSYTVNVSIAGSYTIIFRTASLNGGGVIQLDKDAGATVLGTVNVASTGGWQNWANSTLTANLPAGTYTIGIKAKSGGFNLNNFKITSNVAFYQKIEAESYNQKSTAPRSETCSEGGLDMGWIGNGDWFTYPVTIPSAGNYVVNYRVASAGSGGRIQLDKDAGATKLGYIDVPGTGGWQNWTTVSQTVSLPSGTYNLGLNAVVGGFNINWIEISSANTLKSATFVIETTSSKSSINFVYPNPCHDVLTVENLGSTKSTLVIMDLSGHILFKQVLQNGANLISVTDWHAGVYMAKITSGNSTEMVKIIKE